MPDRATDRPQSKRHFPRSKAQVRPTTEFYVVQTERWDWSFSFGVNPSRKHFPVPYSDYRHVEVHGQLLRPKAARAEMAGLTFLPRLDLDLAAVADLPASAEPKAIGSAHVRAGAFQGLLSMPHDVLASLLTALTAGQLHYVTLEGEPLFRGQAMIRRFSFRAAYDPNGLPDEVGRAR